MDIASRVIQLARRCGGSYRRRWPGDELLGEIRELEDSISVSGVDAMLNERCMLAQMRLDYELASSLARQLLDQHPSQRELLTLHAAIGVEREFWRSLGLTPQELESLGAHLHNCAVDPDDRPESPDDLRHTHAWIDQHCPDRRDRIIEGLRSQGGFCDAEVLTNVVD